MKIIVTGATGSLGGYLTRYFSAKGHDVLAVGRMENPPPALLSCSKFLRADISKSFSLPDADVVIHAAALADDKAKPEALYATNIRGTENVLQASSRAQVFIHVSSSSVYLPSEDPITEEMALWNSPEKLSHYGASKLRAEGLALTAKNSSVFILRPRGIYGPGDKVLLPRLMKLVKNDKLIVAGKMQVKLSMTHFINFAEAVEACIYSGKRGNHTYNIADDHTYILYNVIKKLLGGIFPAELPERNIPLWMLKTMSAIKVGEVTPLFLNTVSKNMMLDISKIKKELGFIPKRNLENSLPEILGWINSIGGIEVLRKGENALAWQ